MVPVLLLLAGGAVTFYGIWQFRRWIRETQEAIAAGPRRLETIVDELVATAEATVAAVEEKSESVAEVLERADQTAKRLAEATKAAQEALEALKRSSVKPGKEPDAPKPSPGRTGGGRSRAAATAKPPARAAGSGPRRAPAPAPTPPAEHILPGVEVVAPATAEAVPGRPESHRPAAIGAPRTELKSALPDPRQAEMLELLGRRPLPLRPQAADHPVAARPAEPAPPRKEAGASPVDLPDLHRRIYGLADAGLDITDIARQLSMTKGEVQLILGLRRMN